MKCIILVLYAIMLTKIVFECLVSQIEFYIIFIAWFIEYFIDCSNKF